MQALSLIWWASSMGRFIGGSKRGQSGELEKATTVHGVRKVGD